MLPLLLAVALGAPALRETVLPKTSYVETRARPIKGARLPATPAEEQTFSEEILGRYAWSVPSPEDPMERFGHEERTF